MPKLELKGLEIESIAKMVALFGIVLGLIGGLTYGFGAPYFNWETGPISDSVLPVVSIVGGVFGGGIGGLIGGAIFAAFYNVFASRIGGIKMDFETQ